MESISKKSKKVIEENLEELKERHPLKEITRIGARMALQVAIEEEFRGGERKGKRYWEIQG